MSDEDKKITSVQGRPWNVHSTYNNFEEADTARKNLKAMWETESIEGMEIKVKFRNSNGRFVIKTRTPAPPGKTKKKAKNKNG